MPKINFDIPVPLESDVAFNKIKTFLNSENSFKKFDPNLACSFDEANQSCTLNGSQFKASLNLKKEAPSQSKVMIEIELPFALSLFKNKIKDEIEKAFKKVLA